MTQGYFVTGTDTGVGKTLVSVALMRHLQAQGHTVAGMKPVASGCQSTPDGLLNDDALQLQRQASRPAPYRLVNPYAFEPAIAPHLAAEAAGVAIETETIVRHLAELSQGVDRVVVEGVGGWLVPIDASHDMADVAAALRLPVILVVAIRLGCLNHALLSARAIEASPLPFAGWIANRLDPACERQEANIAALRARLPAPCLGELAYQRQVDVAIAGARFDPALS